MIKCKRAHNEVRRPRWNQCSFILQSEPFSPPLKSTLKFLYFAFFLTIMTQKLSVNRDSVGQHQQFSLQDR